MADLIATPGQARAEALGIPQGKGPATTAVEALARQAQLARVQGSIDVATAAVAVVAAQLLGSSMHKLDLSAFGPAREIPEKADAHVRKAIEAANKQDDEHVIKNQRRLAGAMVVARGLLSMAAQAVMPSRPEEEGEAAQAQAPEPDPSEAETQEIPRDLGGEG